EDVAEVPAAGAAEDLGPHAVGVRQAPDRPRDLVVETRPAAARPELGLGPVDGRPTPPARVGPGDEVLLVLPAVGALRALVDDDSLLLGRQGPPLGHIAAPPPSSFASPLSSIPLARVRRLYRLGAWSDGRSTGVDPWYIRLSSAGGVASKWLP